MIAVSNKSRITGNLSGAQNLEDYLVTMPEIRETMECACAEFEQRICYNMLRNSSASSISGVESGQMRKSLE